MGQQWQREVWWERGRETRVGERGRGESACDARERECVVVGDRGRAAESGGGSGSAVVRESGTAGEVGGEERVWDGRQGAELCGMGDRGREVEQGLSARVCEAWKDRGRAGGRVAEQTEERGEGAKGRWGERGG
eukprot:55802-Eustigmatos_ZCMA.PRE.2